MSGSGAAAQRAARELPHLLGALVAIGVYVALHALERPLFVYLPIERAVVWQAPSGAVTMKLFGIMAGGALGYVVGQAAGRVAWVRAAARPRMPALRAALALVAIAAMVYFAGVELGPRI